MSRRLLFLPLVAALPALLCAQQPKLVNCRALEAAGNFVGPDEVIVDDLVCQKAKPGTQTNASSQAPKAIPGVVISGDEGGSVVDAAKAATKRVAAAKEAIREKAEQAGEQVTPAVPPTDRAPSPAPAETPAQPEPTKAPEAAAPAPKQPVSLPVTPPQPIVAETPQQPAPSATAAENNGNPAKSAAAGVTEPSTTPAAQQAVGNFMNAVEKATSPEPASNTNSNAPPQSLEPGPSPAPPQAPVAPEPTPTPAQSQPAATTVPEPPHTENAAPAPQVTTKQSPATAETATSPEVVLKSAPVAELPAPATAPATVASAPAPVASSPEPTVEAPKPAEAAVPAGGTGFYDANAGTNVVTNPPPAEAAQPEPRKPSETELAAAAAAKAAAEEAEASWRAPDPNLPRERVVETGAFAEPKEVGPDPTALAHKTTFQPGDTEGFEEGHRSGCTKNITIAGLKGEKLVLGTPAWAERWIEKNQKRMLEICFSDTPMTSAKNYLVVFYTAPAQAAGPAAPPQGAPAGGVGAFTLSYGSTWHYAQERNVGVTVLTRDEADEPQAELGKVWYATAYTEEGVPVSEHWPEKAKKPIQLDEKDTKSKKAREARAELERVSDDLLDQMVGDIAKL